MTTDHADATAHALANLPATLSEVARATRTARVQQADAVELLRRAAPVAAMYRARRIAAYSVDDIAALTSFADLVHLLTAEQEGPHA